MNRMSVPLTRQHLRAAICVIIVAASTSLSAAPDVKEPEPKNEKVAESEIVPTPPEVSLPKAVKDYLSEHLKGYEAVGKQDYEQWWFEEVTDFSPCWSLRADFDGNSKDDYALLMKKDQKVVFVVVRAIEKGYVHDVLNNDISDLPVRATLQLQGPGLTSVDMADAEKPEMKNLMNSSVTTRILETDDHDYLHYWENGQWHEAYIGL